LRSHHLEVTRTARYCTLGVPSPEVRELWLVCHGYGQLAAAFLEGFRVLAVPERLIVAPEALSRFYVGQEQGAHGPDSPVGATWMTREDRLVEIEDYVAYLDRLHREVEGTLRSDCPLRRIALGFSQGTATIARWAARTDAPIEELVLWGGRLPPELDPVVIAKRWQGARVTLVAGSRDRWIQGKALREEAASLAAHGVATRVMTFEGGHRLDAGTLQSVAEMRPREV
jgi:predicted esterase